MIDQEIFNKYKEEAMEIAHQYGCKTIDDAIAKLEYLVEQKEKQKTVQT